MSELTFAWRSCLVNFMRFTLRIYLHTEHQAVYRWPWSIFIAAVGTSPRTGLISFGVLVTCSHRQTSAALPCVNVCQDGFSASAQKISHNHLTLQGICWRGWAVKESRGSVGKAPFTSQSYAPVFFEFVSVQLFCHQSFFNPLLEAFFSPDSLRWLENNLVFH